ncbi:hypothetical protein C8Q74DRAFT_797990 [Fomes fomentarius]|nr:hypothetical protein C8Q74DRAFT_797990 [Fomes fomentarius]
MSYSEDAQPNEMRHARKGNTVVPTIQTSQPTVGRHRRGRGFANDNTGRGGGHRGSFNPGIRARGGAFHPNLQPRAFPPHLASGSRGSHQNRGQHPNRRSKKAKLVHAAIGHMGTSQNSSQHQVPSHRAPRGIAHEDSGKEDPWTQHWLSYHQHEAPAHLSTVVQDHGLSMSALNHSPLHGDQDALLASSAHFEGPAALSDTTLTGRLRNDDSELTSYTIVKQEPSPSPSQLPSPPLLVTILPDSPQFPHAPLLNPTDEPGTIGGLAEQTVSPHASVPVSVHLAKPTERAPKFRSGKLRFRLPQRRRSPDAVDSTAKYAASFAGVRYL